MAVDGHCTFSRGWVVVEDDFLAGALADLFVVRRPGAVGCLSLATGVPIPFGSLAPLVSAFSDNVRWRVSKRPKVRQVTGSSVAAGADTGRHLLADLRGHGEHHAILDAVIIVVCPLPLLLSAAAVELMLLLTLPVVFLAVLYHLRLAARAGRSQPAPGSVSVARLLEHVSRRIYRPHCRPDHSEVSE